MVEDLREDLNSKAEKHEFERMQSESENNKKMSQKLPSREEFLNRLENHTKVIDGKLNDLKNEFTPAVKTV